LAAQEPRRDLAELLFDPHSAAAAEMSPGFDQDEAWVFYQGEQRRYRDSRIGLMTHALHYGTACFEGIRAYWNDEREQLYIFRALEHFQRLHQSAAILRMELPYSAEELVETSIELLRRNQFRTDTYIRPLVYKSSQEIGVRLHNLEDSFLIYTQPFGEYHERSRALRCMVSTWRRVDDNAAPARAKISGIYINSALAKTEAFENGLDEAIVLGQDGHVCEGSAENLFIIRKGTLITPPVSDNILEGITRSTLMQYWTEDLGLPLVERPIDRTELYIADEVILCGTGAQISGVGEIDHRQVGDGKVGPFTRQLDEVYTRLVRGQIEKYREWCTPVY
jgi:branched-chain amino acid aminotransferase